MSALIFLPRQLSEVLDSAPRGLARINPARPTELDIIYKDISQWAKPTMRWLTENAKMDKPVRGSKWILRGVSFLPAQQIGKVFFKSGKIDRERLKEFNITEAQAKALKSERMCPHATQGCMAVCLSTSGQLGLPNSIQAQVRRQIIYKQNRPAFMTILVLGIASLYKTARKGKARLGIRLNVTSDLSWEDLSLTINPWLAKYLKTQYGHMVKPGNYRNLMEVFPKVMFYDYTKVNTRMLKYLTGDFPPNYHLTWSLAEISMNRKMALEILKRKGGSVSVAFDIVMPKDRPGQPKMTLKQKAKKAPLPKTLTIIDQQGRKHTFKVTDADMHDLRPMDLKGTWAGLRFKVPKNKKLAGMKDREKMEAAGAFVVKTKGSPHPVIRIER